MRIRLLSTSLFMIGAALLLNTHMSGADQCKECEKAKASGSALTQPAAPGIVSVTPAVQKQQAGKNAAKLEVADFTLADQNGKPVKLSDYAGKIIVLEWINPQCPYVQRHYNSKTMQDLADKYADKGVVWLAINSTSAANQKANKDWAEKHNVKYPILDDSAGKVGREYGAKTTPHMFIIDRSGKLVYKGAIDNDPQGDKTDRVNHVDQALQKLTQGQTVVLQETKPYGCSVKYSKATAQAR